jgi:formylglycine-generating enzyme required for sulfatase activity
MKSSTGLLLLLICMASPGNAVMVSGSSPTSAAGTKPGAQFHDCEGCPEMIAVPAGRFTIGSPPDEPGRREDEGPQAEIQILRPFAVGRYEVTRRQYEAFVRDTNHPVRGHCMTDRRKPGNWSTDAGTNFHDPGFPQTGDHPAACVSWNDAKAYLAWLNGKAGGGYRLLTEAEWEYVARAGSTTAYPWGATIHDGCTHMNGYDRVIAARKGDLYKDEAVSLADCSDGHLNTAPVGSYAPNAFGVYDMIGNLGEWIEDCSTQSYASIRPDGTAAAGDCSKRMVRGGSWGTMPRQLRSAERIRYEPTAVDDSIGIRVAKTLVTR